MVKRALTLLTSILFALPLLMPFNIYANATHQVQTNYLSTVSSEWTNSMVFTSYCEGTNSSTASCVLTVNITKSPKNYFGTVTIHGYDSSGTKWINYGDIFVSAGTGVYNYNFYQNGIKEISRVEVYSTNLIQPSSTVDLSQIISLLTSINNYEQQNKNLLDDIVNNTDTIEINQLENINQIKNVISELIVSNGYLEDISEIRSWNLPFESLRAVFSTLYYNKPIDLYSNSYINNYPIFKFPSTDNKVMKLYVNRNTVLISINRGGSLSSLNSYFELSNENVTFRSCEVLETIFYEIDGNKSYFYVNKITFNTSEETSYNTDLMYKNTATSYFVPIFFGANLDNVSVDFALRYRLSNRLLDDINLIANGTTASQSAADSSQSANEQLQTDSNTLFQQENGFKSDMNNAMNNVNNTFRLQDMGTKFVSSAQWVRTQYESLTNNTPFASLITFSLITGLALILLGKVYK